MKAEKTDEFAEDLENSDRPVRFVLVCTITFAGLRRYSVVGSAC